MRNILVDFAMSQSKRLVIGSFLILLLLAAGMWNLSFNSSYRVFFSEDNPYLLAFDHLNEQFSSPENISFVLESKKGSLINSKDIQTIEGIVDRAYELPFSTRVEAFTNFPFTKTEGDTFVVEDLIPNVKPLDETTLSRIRNAIEKEESVQGRLINDKHNFAVVTVQLTYPKQTSENEDKVVQAAEIIRTQVQANNPGVNVWLFGTTFLAHSTLVAADLDGQTLVPAMFVFSILAGYLILRSVALVFASQLIIFTSVLAAMGLAGWLKYELNSVSAMAGLLIMILALADSIHIGSTFLKELQSGMDKKSALKSSLEKNMLAVFLTSITTVMGFASLNFINSSAFSDLGNIAIFGVLIALIFSFTLFPGLLMLLVRDSEIKGIRQIEVSRWIAKTAIEKRRSIAVLFALLVLTTAPFITQNRFNIDFLKFFDPGTDVRQATDAFVRNLPNIHSIQYSIETNQENGINDPAFLEKVDAFLSWYENQEGVSHSYSYVDVIKRLNRDMHGGNSEWYKIPNDRQLASQYLLLYEISLGSGQSLEELLDMDRSALKVSIMMDQSDAQRILGLEQKARNWLQLYAPDLQVSEGVSNDILFARQTGFIVEAMTKGSLVTILFVTLTIMLGIRSIRYGLISLIPNLVPALVVYGVWGMLVKEMNHAVAVTYSVSLGLIVDDTVHILSKYISQRRKGVSPEEAIYFTLENTATALIVTSVMIGGGLMIMAFATFLPNAQIGMVMAPIIFIALLFDLFLLPGLLLYFDKKKVELQAANKLSEHKPMTAIEVQQTV